MSMKSFVGNIVPVRSPTQKDESKTYESKTLLKIGLWAFVVFYTLKETIKRMGKRQVNN